MAVQASSIISRVADILNDAGHVRWPDTELIRWINDAQNEISIHRPDCCVKRVPFLLAAGTLQTLPATGLRMVDVTRNLGTDGTTIGRTIKFVDKRVLDEMDRNWHTAKAAATIIHFTMDPRDPKHFFVYPQPAGSVNVELVYSAVPAPVAADADNIGVDDIYETPIVDYVAYRSFCKDSEAVVGQRAIFHRQAFDAAIGIKAQTDAIMSPKEAAAPAAGAKA